MEVPQAQEISLLFVEMPFFILKELVLLKCRPFLEALGTVTVMLWYCSISLMRKLRYQEVC